MKKCQPQVLVRAADGAMVWKDCCRSDGVRYGPYMTLAEATAILGYYNDGSAIYGETHRVKVLR